LLMLPIPKRGTRRSGVTIWSGLRASTIGCCRRRIGCIRRNGDLLVDSEAKEARSIPVGTGDGSGDGGEAGIGGLAPDKAICNDRDGVTLALVFPHKHGAGLEAPRAVCWWPGTAREAREMLGGFRIKPLKHLLLDVPGEESCDQILGEALRR